MISSNYSMRCVVSVPHRQITTSMTIFQALTDCCMSFKQDVSVSISGKPLTIIITRAINLPDLIMAQGLPALSMESRIFLFLDGMRGFSCSNYWGNDRPHF